MPSIVTAARAQRFHDKVALVVGVGSGTGLAVALRLGLEGAKVIAVARSEAHVEAAEAAMLSHGIDGRALRADVSTASGAATATAAAIDRFGGLDVAISTAGGYEGGSFDQTDSAGVERMLDSNFRTAFHLAKTTTPCLESRGGGSIVVTTAVFGSIVPGPGLLAYNTSKAAVSGFLQSLAGDLAAKNIRVNAVLPGGITHQFDVTRDVALGRKLAKGPSQPEDIAAAVAFLASDEACFVTGAALVVDGGFSVGRKAF